MRKPRVGKVLSPNPPHTARRRRSLRCHSSVSSRRTPRMHNYQPHNSGQTSNNSQRNTTHENLHKPWADEALAT